MADTFSVIKRKCCQNGDRMNACEMTKGMICPRTERTNDGHQGILGLPLHNILLPVVPKAGLPLAGVPKFSEAANDCGVGRRGTVIFSTEPLNSARTRIMSASYPKDTRRSKCAVENRS